jgi:hypothetical protein
MTSRFDAAGQPGFGQRVQDVVDGLCGHRTELIVDRLTQRVGTAVRALDQTLKDSYPWCRNS